MMSQQTKSTGIISAVATAVSVVGLLWLVVVISDMGENLVSVKQTLAEVRADKVERKQIEELVIATEEERLELDAFVLKGIEDVGVIKLVSFLEEIAFEQGIDFETKKLVIEPNKNTQFETLVIDVTAKGSFEAIVHLIKLYEQMPYQIVVENVFFNKGSGLLNWDSTLRLKVVKYRIL